MFSKDRPAEAGGRAGGRLGAQPTGSTFSMIGPDVAITGDLTASADLHVDGRVTGDIACASLVQGEASEIEGAIVAESARLSGRVTGSVTVRELTVMKSARIEGDVRYDSLTIEQGAQVEGHFAHSREPAPASESVERKLTLAT